jgi:hypothetical protein
MEKTKIKKISFGHLWVVELAYRKIFSHCLPPVSFTPVEKFAAGVVDRW